MRDNTYDPKRLLDVLIDVERQLNSALDDYCPPGNPTEDTDFDQKLNDFLDTHPLKDNEVALLSTQMAVLGLLREIEKTKHVVIETNNLRALEDFIKSKYRRTEEESQGRERKSKRLVNSSCLTILCIVLVVLLLMVLFAWLWSTNG